MNHIIILYIALWAVIRAALAALLAFIFSKIAGKLSCKMFMWANSVAAVLAILLAIHFWANHAGGWIIVGLVGGLFLGGCSSILFPKPADWEKCIEY